MYNRVLVPLDGSSLAECVFDHLIALAKSGNIGEVMLLRVVEIPPGWAKEGVDFQGIQGPIIEEAKVYLSQVRDRLAKGGISKIMMEVSVGKPADRISESARKHGIDMILIATHGSTGIAKWVLGSVADRIVHTSHVPVLVIRPEGCRL